MKNIIIGLIMSLFIVVPVFSQEDVVKFNACYYTDYSNSETLPVGGEIYFDTISFIGREGGFGIYMLYDDERWGRDSYFPIVEIIETEDEIFYIATSGKGNKLEWIYVKEEKVYIQKFKKTKGNRTTNWLYIYYEMVEPGKKSKKNVDAIIESHSKA